MLLAKTLRSSTFGLALLLIGIFGAAVIALLSYVYWSTASYVRSRADHAIAAELALLEAAYDGAGRAGLTAAIAQRIAGKQLEGGVYLLADASFAPLAGNLQAWPASLQGTSGWGSFSAREWKPDAAQRPLLRATFEPMRCARRRTTSRDRHSCFP